MLHWEILILIRCHGYEVAFKSNMLHALFFALPASPYLRSFQVSFRPVEHGDNVRFAWSCSVTSATASHISRFVMPSVSALPQSKPSQVRPVSAICHGLEPEHEIHVVVMNVHSYRQPRHFSFHTGNLHALAAMLT
jgi:hypothetical protein